MPYGFAKKLGGDSPANDRAMESCVAHVMSTGKDKVSAIRICKVAIARQRARAK